MTGTKQTKAESSIVTAVCSGERVLIEVYQYVLFMVVYVVEVVDKCEPPVNIDIQEKYERDGLILRIH